MKSTEWNKYTWSARKAVWCGQCQSQQDIHQISKLFCKLNLNYVISLQGDHHLVTVSYKMSGGKA